MAEGPRHIPVLESEVLTLLDPRPGDVVLDCTAGLGGHAAAIASRIGTTGTLILNDLDPSNLAAAAARVRAVSAAPAVIELHGNFADAPRRLAIERRSADVVLADLGFASVQMDDPMRGFAFSREGPLDMRFDPSSPGLTAAGLVNTYSERELADLLHSLGEEPAARRIARKIVEARRDAPIETTAQLAELVRSVVRPRPGERIDPATRTFQALRIAVNDELGNLDAFLDHVAAAAAARQPAQAVATAWLRPGARVGIISFHSLEDRRVKQCFAALHDQGVAERLTKKPVVPSDAELEANPRSRSARLRALRVLPRE